MVEEYKFQLTLSTPPVGQYAKGNMLNIRADTYTEFRNQIALVFGEDKVNEMLAEQFKAYTYVPRSTEFD